MNRRDSFEQAYAESHDLPIETFSQYRMGDTYRLPGIAKCWRFWNLALDSVELKLPEPDWSYENFGSLLAKDDVIKMIDDAGLKVSG